MSGRVLPEVHAAVMRRDRECIAALLDKSHGCRDRWGEPHEPDHMARLTIEHVKTDPGGRRRHDEGHLVAMCHSANVSHWGASTENRRLLNAFLWGCRKQAAA